MKIKNLIAVIFSVIVLFGCSENSTEPTKYTLDELYQIAVWDAMVAEESEIVNTLTSISKDNPDLIWQQIDGEDYVLVATFTDLIRSFLFKYEVNTYWGETWVTVVPELKDWFNNNDVKPENYIIRTKQLLGLPPGSYCSRVAEFWVKPEDLYRPAYNYEIAGTSSDIFFDGTETTDYKTWFNANIIYSYYPERDGTPYPWTRLGYTYDWGNENSEVGLSEFVVKEESQIIVKSLETLEEYLAK